MTDPPAMQYHPESTVYVRAHSWGFVLYAMEGEPLVGGPLSPWVGQVCNDTYPSLPDQFFMLIYDVQATGLGFSVSLVPFNHILHLLQNQVSLLCPRPQW